MESGKMTLEELRKLQVEGKAVEVKIPIGQVANDALAQIDRANDRPKRPVVEAPTYTPSDDVRRTQRILEAMERRRQERSRLVAELKSRCLEVERQDTEEREALTSAVEKLRADTDSKIAHLNSRFLMDKDLRMEDLTRREREIEKIDATLENFRRQLDVELGKLDPARKAQA